MLSKRMLEGDVSLTLFALYPHLTEAKVRRPNAPSVSPNL